MKKITLLLINLIAVLNLCLSQNTILNNAKYQTYKQRLLNKFVVVSPNVEEFGNNIPAHNYDLDANYVGWGDANSNMSNYISILVTEYRLLKNSNRNYIETLKQLYYALLALERIDLYSEGCYKS